MAGYARAAIVTASLAAALGVASCSDGADAEPTPTSTGSSSSASSGTGASPTSSASASTSSSTATVNVPAAARAHTEEGAKAFAKFFVETVNESQTSADPGKLRAISEAGCKGCNSFADGADQLRTKGQRVDRPSLKVDGVLVRPDSTPNKASLDLLINEQASKTVDAQGKVVESFDSDRFTLRATVAWKGQAWIMQQALLVTS